MHSPEVTPVSHVGTGPHAPTEIIDATAEEIPGQGVELVRAPHSTPGIFRTDDPVEVVTEAARVADALKDVIVRKGLTERIQGKEHVKVEGWQLLGAMFDVTAVCVATEAVDGGFKATVEARTSDGRVIGRADALCTKHEKRGPWKNADDYARLSMAQTRATSKALKGPLGFVISLAGYQTTPAEEMTFVDPDPPVPVEMRPITDEARARIAQGVGETGQSLDEVLSAAGFKSLAAVRTVGDARRVKDELGRRNGGQHA